ncbi:MAG: hypothetical protein WC476_13160, partial [Phycisphaerae bacterium]
MAILVVYHGWSIYKHQKTDGSLTLVLSLIMVIGVVGDYLLLDPVKYATNLNNIEVVNDTQLNLYYASMFVPCLYFVGLFLYYRVKKSVPIILLVGFLVFIIVNLIANYLLIKVESVHIVFAGVVDAQLTELSLSYVISVFNPLLLVLAISTLFFAKYFKNFSVSS